DQGGEPEVRQLTRRLKIGAQPEPGRRVARNFRDWHKREVRNEPGLPGYEASGYQGVRGDRNCLSPVFSQWRTTMKLPRRKFLHLAAGAAAVPAVSRIARAQAYPTRPVRIVVGVPAGGSFDIVARLIGQ